MKKKYLILAALVCSIPAFSAIDEKYPEGYNLESLEVNTAQKEHSMSLYNDGSLIFLKDNTVYVSEIDTTKGQLSDPIEVATLSALGITGTVAYNEEKKTIYFSLPESETSEWLYQSTLEEGIWSSPKRLEIEGLQKTRGNNSFMGNAGWSYASKPKIVMKNPTLSKEGDRIYFTSATIDNGVGGNDIWFIDKKDDKMWDFPVNAGVMINTEADEDYAFVENDSIIYFSRSEQDYSDLYNAQLTSDTTWAKAASMGDAYNSTVSDYNMLVFSGIPFLISDRNTGNSDDIFAFVKIPEPEPIPEVIPEPEPIPEPKVFKWTLFLFDFDKSDFKAEFKEEFDSIVTQMKDFPEAKFEIAGHTDRRGSNAYNMSLSLRRAEQIKDMLVKAGLPEEKLVVKACGEEQPTIADPKTKEDFYQNRRVEIRIINIDESAKL